MNSSTTIEVRAPSEQSEGTRSQIQRWLKSVGDSVVENEPLIEVETDKVTIEIPAPASGVLREILKQEQDEIAPGELLAILTPARNGADHNPTAGAESGAPAELGTPIDVGTGAEPDAEPGTRAEFSAEFRTSIGSRTSIQSRTPTQLSTPTQSGTGAESGTPTFTDAAAAAEQTPDNVRVAAMAAHADVISAGRSSPAVRRLLAEHGVDASRVRGSGAGGRITVDDVLAYVASRTKGRGEQARASAPAPTLAEGAGAARRVPHSSMRKRIAERMVTSLLHTAPHVTTVFEADMSAVIAHRARRRKEYESRGVSLTLTAYFIAACVEAIREVPEANSRWTDDALEIYETVDIGVGAALEGKGLVVPVVRNAQSLDLLGIAKALGDLVSRAREDKLTPADVRGGTFTISNHGVSGSLVATPIIINQPQSAILGVGKLEKRVVVLTENGEDRIVIRPRCYVTLTIDHRVMDGHRANRFLDVLVGRLESWPEE